MKKYLAELIGTAALCLIGCGAIVIGAYPGDYPMGILPIGLAFGLSIMGMTAVIGPISGCHINPAVTVAMVAAGRLPASEAPGYIVAQFVGAFVGCGFLALILMNKVGGYDIPAGGLAQTTWNPYGGYTAVGAIIAEFVATFLFTLVFLGATLREPSSLASGLVTGLTFTVLHLVFVPVSGASFNPARSFAPAVYVGGDAFAQVGVYLIVPTIAGILAGLLYRTRLLAAD